MPTEIFFGVRRPVRTLSLQQPVQIGPLAIASLGVRTSGQSYAASAPGEVYRTSVDDEEDIIVSAKGIKHDPRSDTISLAADHLSRCSSIVFDRKRKVIELTCA